MLCYLKPWEAGGYCRQGQRYQPRAQEQKPKHFVTQASFPGQKQSGILSLQQEHSIFYTAGGTWTDSMAYNSLLVGGDILDFILSVIVKV